MMPAYSPLQRVSAPGSAAPPQPSYSPLFARGGSRLAQTQHASSNRKRGAGFLYLQQQLEESLSSGAQSVLSNLLENHNVHLSSSPAPPDKKKPRRKPIEMNMSDERIMQLAQAGELSFLASLLKVIELEGGTVTTKFLIKACCLSVEPARVPALCDAKELVMAALYFLSQSFTPESTDKKKLFPMIYPVTSSQGTTISNDLEKRMYVKAGHWRLVDVLPQVLELEDIFFHTVHPSKWMAREHACPADLPMGRNLLLLKGNPPSYMANRIKRLAGPRPRKQQQHIKPSTTTPSATSGFGDSKQLSVVGGAVGKPQDHMGDDHDDDDEDEDDEDDEDDDEEP